ncbi:transposase [Streptomyces sp. RKAG293]|uniref:transposase n=1 Tax=Streptomyces sp. RKAG293 TaxID=2893403 RepID=UPI002034029F|nr:transposase [Streptomyces sp. RKAG293]MCM2416655.1 transposase [Streptomyces sp. RKAG293]
MEADAIEVADRWHLLQNLGAAVEKTCQQHRSCLRKQAEQDEPPQAPAVALPLPVLPRTPIVEPTRERYADGHRLADRGWTVSAIARHLQLDRKTVLRFRDAALDELLASAKDLGVHRRDQLVPFMPYLHARFAVGIISGRRLFEEIGERGYQGGYSTLITYLARLREGAMEPVRADVPSPRRITSWIMRPRDTLTELEEERLQDVEIACPDIARACDLARSFHDLLAHRRGHLLLEWIRQAEQDTPAPVRSFAGFLRQDLAAVTAGLTLEWSSGMVEGHVNKIKMIKRTMLGRSSFRLLRIRVLTRHENPGIRL